jgi:uncharacterized protein (TIGR01777 family)
MKVLITGATGLVGKELGKQLAKQGHSIVVLARDPKRAKTLLPFEAEVFPWSAETDIPTSEALQGVEAVIHLAGESIAKGRWTDERKKKIYESRILGTRNLVAGIKQSSSIKILISASAIGIYGDNGSELLNENHQQGDDYLACVCKDWEKETLAVADKVRVINLRIGVVLSRQGGALEKLLPLFSLGLGGIIGKGTQWMSWIHLQDLINIVQFVLSQNSMRGPYNAVAPKPVTNKVFSEILAQSLSRRLFFPVPSLAMKLAMGEMSTIVLASQNVDSQKLVSEGFAFSYPELSLALGQICRS